MNRSPEALAFQVSAASVPAKRESCAYCDAPLPTGWLGAAPSDSLPKYCCYGCRVLGEAGRKPADSTGINISPWFKIAVGAVLAGQAMLLGLAANLTPPTGSARWLLHAALMLSSFAALAILGRPLLQSALEEMRRWRPSVELLFLAGIGGALGASVYSTFSGVGAIYYEVVAVLLTVYSVGRTLGAQSRVRALAETRCLQRTFETCRKIAGDGSVVTARVAEIQAGDEVRVLAGEPIPIDGRITQGQAFVCETPLTGEPFPVVRRAGDAVFAGSYSEDGELRISATVPGAERRLDGILSALQAARERPCRIQAQADRIVCWFLPLELAVSAGTFFFWSWRTGWPDGLFNALAVLLVACPCAMGLATPIAIWGALASLAARGLVVRGGDAIERLAGLDRMIFDKTGTLSEEQYSLIDLALLEAGEERDLIIEQLRAVQNATSHPVARAFHSPNLTAAPSAFRVRSFKTVPARGVEAWLESGQGAEHHLRVGRRELLLNPANETELLSRLRRTPGDNLVYVEVDNRLRAIAAVRERLRDSAGEAIRSLQAQGIECAVMTGDSTERAAQLLGRNHVQGGMTPQDKADRIETLRQAGHKAGFVGDGLNDAPAMQAASLGIALAHGAGVTTAVADGVLYGGDLRVVPWAVVLARQVRGSIRSNLIFAAAYNVIGMALAATGYLHPVASAMLMVLSSFAVSWRALRSAECADDCCAVISAAPPTPVTAPDAATGGGRWFQIACGIAIVAQAPFLVYLGQLSGMASVLTWAVMLGLGILIVRFRPRNPGRARVAHMIFAMLGLGNWGMILGWWVDAGFGPVGAACRHCAAHGFSLWSCAAMPWMNLGMLLFGLPPMLFEPSRSRFGLGRLWVGFLSALGMVLGMSFGNFVFMKCFGPMVANGFLLSFAGMTAGMLLGMFLGCEFGRSLTLALPRRNIRDRM
jgi:heavy metal translocating P-type ATPase